MVINFVQIHLAEIKSRVKASSLQNSNNIELHQPVGESFLPKPFLVPSYPTSTPYPIQQHFRQLSQETRVHDQSFNIGPDVYSYPTREVVDQFGYQIANSPHVIAQSSFASNPATSTSIFTGQQSESGDMYSKKYNPKKPSSRPNSSASRDKILKAASRSLAGKDQLTLEEVGVKNSSSPKLRRLTAESGPGPKRPGRVVMVLPATGTLVEDYTLPMIQKAGLSTSAATAAAAGDMPPPPAERETGAAETAASASAGAEPETERSPRSPTPTQPKTAAGTGSTRNAKATSISPKPTGNSTSAYDFLNFKTLSDFGYTIKGIFSSLYFILLCINILTSIFSHNKNKSCLF